jgi:cytoskeletal protein RodZ
VDPTLVNCPSCRGSLNWPTPQKIRAFPKQKRAVKQKEKVEFDETQGKPAKKRDPWLMGCLVLIALVIVAGIAIWILDMFAQQTPSAIPAPYPVSSNQSGSIQIENTVLEIS